MIGGATIECRNLWRVYGTTIDRATNFTGENDSATLAANLRRGGAVVAVSDVTLEIKPGETFVIMGLSGSGKSTLVRCLSRLIEPSAGGVRIDGQDLLKLSESELIALRRQKMGMVFQHFGLLPHMTVLENVAYPLRVQGLDPVEREKRAFEVIELVGLNGRERAYPRELSGGMQQRVGIARSLAVKPAIWFLDEPFSALDPLIRRQMQDEFLRLQASLKKTIVFITHDFLEALRLADRIAIMRDGRVIQVGTPSDVVLRPADSYVAEFTHDVPRERVLTAGDIMEETQDQIDLEGSVPAGALIEDIIPKLVGRQRPIAVRGEENRILGLISSDRVLAALAPAAPSRR
jgi:glycine betaine/proline transport system ATP-binding protein